MKSSELRQINNYLFGSDVQNSLSKYIGVNQATVSRWMNKDGEVPHYVSVILAHLVERKEGGFDPFIDVPNYPFESIMLQNA